MRKIYQEANEVLSKWGMPEVPLNKNAAHMNVEIRKIVEIARALSTDPDVLILDEVTQALAQDNRKKLHALIENFKSMGKSIILITHDLEEMLEITDTISILRDGELIETVNSKEIDEDTLKTKMVGRSLEGEYYRSDKEASRGDTKILSVENLSTASGLDDVSFDLYGGEILGLAGLSDSGIHEVGKAVYGLEHLTGGKVTLVQDSFEVKNATQAWNHRVGYVPKDRDNEALMLKASIRENFSMSSVPEMAGTLGFLSNKKLDKVSSDAREQFMVKSVGIKQEIDALSGGNKQKVNMGRWLLKDLQLFVVDCPTRGVDVGVKAYLYQCLKDAKKEGLAILLITDELPEAIGMSDRILVMKNGKITGEVSRSDGLSEEAIVKVMI
jgi:ribose transport system ATP-binding protein